MGAIGLSTGRAAIAISLAGNSTVRLTWSPANWRLQSAAELPMTGNPMWSDVPATSPFVLPTQQGKRFFRAVSPDGTACSSNVVGFVNLAVLPGNNLLGNPFNGTNNHLNTILPLASDGSQDRASIYRWKVPTQMFGPPIQWFSGTGWTANEPGENYIFNPGEGFAFENPFPGPFNVTFVGDVLQGNISNTIPGGLSLWSSPVPQDTLLSMLFPALDGDAVSILNPATQQFTTYQYIAGFGWEPDDPLVPVGTSVFIQSKSARVWTQTFNVACTGPAVAPQISQHPQSQNVFIGSGVTFDVVASGTPPLGYQWFFNGDAMSGATGPSHTIPAVQLNHSGDYSVTVSNAGGSVTSTKATLKVYGPVVINEWMAINTGAVFDPADGKADDWFEVYNAGTSTVNLNGFRISNNPNNPDGFQIQGNIVLRPQEYLLFWADDQSAQGPTHLNFVLPDSGGAIALFTPNSLLMDCVTFGPQSPNVSQGRSPDASPNIATLPQPTPLGPNGGALAIIAQPQDQTVNCYGTAIFAVGASGVAPLSFQWRRNGCEDIPGANAATLTLSNVTLADAGNYSVMVSDASGRITSDDASLVLNPTGLPRLRVLEGTNIVISWPQTCQDFVLQEVEDLRFPIQWKGAGRHITLDDTNHSITFPLSESSGFFRLGASSTRITSQPKGRAVNFQDVVRLSVEAVGQGPFNYQWRQNGRVIDGESNSTLTVNVGSPVNLGAYEAVVIDSAMAHLSAPAFLRPAAPETVLPDNLADRKATSAASGLIYGTTFNATREALEPMHDGVAGGKSVWFSWRPPGPGVATFDTVGSSFDTLLAVYQGSSYSNLTLVTSDDDSADRLWSRVIFNASPEVEYLIAIDGSAGASGYFLLNWNLDTASPPIATILAQPQHLTVVPNDKATFSVIATSPQPATLTYQWFRNRAGIPGATQPQFTVDLARLQDVGEYFVVVGNGQRPIESRHALLQLSTDPVEFRLEPKMAFDFLCDEDTINADKSDGRSKSFRVKVAPTSAGTLSGSLASYAPIGGPKGICTIGGINAISYSLVNVASANCLRGSTLSFSLAGTPGYSVIAVYSTLTLNPMVCAAGIEPAVAITALRNKTYRVVIGTYDVGGVVSLSYTNGPCN